MKFIAIGGLGAMLSPSARHLQGTAQCLALLDRGNPTREAERKAWLEHGAKLVSSYEELKKFEFEAVVVCAGKDGDDRLIFEHLEELNFKTLLHLSTISAGFAEQAFSFWQERGVNYLNTPLTGGPKGAKEGTMLVLASGESTVYQKYLPFFEAIGKPKYFGPKPSAGAEVKLIGQVMVFSSLLGMSTAIKLHEKCFPEEDQTEFFDFLNNGAGGCRQWDVALRQGIAHNNWSQGFDIRHAVVDAIYALRLIEEKNLPNHLSETLLRVIQLFTLQLQEEPLATHSILKHLDTPLPDKNLEQLIEELPASVRQTIG